jgi:prepilin-type N-terminal cleavage/methylation domain-containing protein
LTFLTTEPHHHDSTPHTAHSTQHTARGFTLSELLVSLSVLGLIAALTLPSIFSSVKESREKAIFKESINMLQVLHHQGSMEGYTTESLNRYVLANAVTVKTCIRSATEGCTYGVTNNWGSMELHNGAVVWDLITTGGTLTTSNYIWLDVNGSNAPNSVGQDILIFTVCLVDGCPNATRKNVGYMEPWQSNAANIALYQSIFK